MKKETWIILLMAVAALLYFTYPHFRGGWAQLRSVFNRQRSFAVDGTANSGNDSGGVLTNTTMYGDPSSN